MSTLQDKGEVWLIKLYANTRINQSSGSVRISFPPFGHLGTKNSINKFTTYFQVLISVNTS